MATAQKRRVREQPVEDADSPLIAQQSAAEPHCELDRHTIAARAFEIYRERGEAHGADLEDWLRAERELAMTGRAVATSDAEDEHVRGTV